MCFAPHGHALFEHFNVQKWSERDVLCTFWVENVQGRALFRHLNFQKWSEPGKFCTFWLGHVLCAATACHLSTSQLPKVLRRWGVCLVYFDVLRAATARTFSTSKLLKVVRAWGAFSFLTWTCASSHNDVQHGSRCFSEPTFRPSGATNRWKKKQGTLQLFYLFPGLHHLSSDTFSSLISYLVLFSPLALPTSAFPSVQIVGSFDF